MSEPTKEVYEAVAKLNQQRLLRAIAEGDSALIATSMTRLSNALSQVKQYQEEENGSE